MYPSTMHCDYGGHLFRHDKVMEKKGEKKASTCNPEIEHIALLDEA